MKKFRSRRDSEPFLLRSGNDVPGFRGLRLRYWNHQLPESQVSTPGLNSSPVLQFANENNGTSWPPKSCKLILEISLLIYVILFYFSGKLWSIQIVSTNLYKAKFLNLRYLSYLIYKCTKFPDSRCPNRIVINSYLARFSFFLIVHMRLPHFCSLNSSESSISHSVSLISSLNFSWFVFPGHIYKSYLLYCTTQFSTSTFFLQVLKDMDYPYSTLSSLGTASKNVALSPIPCEVTLDVLCN